MVHLRHFVMLTLALSCITQTVYCNEIRYVTDSFRITMRTGPSIQNKIVLMLSSGQPLEVSQEQEDWSHVRVLNRADNLEGWVMRRYLISRLPWERQAGELRQEAEQLRKKLARTEKQLAQVSTQGRGASKELKETSRALAQVRQKYEALKAGAADYLQLKKKHEETRRDLNRSQQELDRLKKQYTILDESESNKWLGMGGLLVLCGLIIGITMGRYKKKQKSSILYG